MQEDLLIYFFFTEIVNELDIEGFLEVYLEENQSTVNKPKEILHQDLYLAALQILLTHYDV